MFYTYILYSEFADKFYIGQTSNIQERLNKHQNKNKGFTNQASDWIIVYQKNPRLIADEYLGIHDINSLNSIWCILEPS